MFLLCSKRRSTGEHSVIILEDTPVKKSRTSATRRAVSEAVREARRKQIKDVIQVDGEEIVVELEQDDEDDDDASSTPEKKSNKENKPEEKQKTHDVKKDKQNEKDDVVAMDTEEAKDKEEERKD